MFYLLALITRAFLASRKLAYSLVDRSVLEWGGMMELCRMEILCLADYVISIPEHWSTTLQLFLPLTLAHSILPHGNWGIWRAGAPFVSVLPLFGPLSSLALSFLFLLKEYINPPRVDTNRHLTKTLVSPGFTYFFLTDRLLELNRWPLEWWKLDVSLKGIQRYINNRCWNNHNHHDNGKKKVSSRLAWCVWMRACRRHCWKRIGAWTMLRVRPISIKK